MEIYQTMSTIEKNCIECTSVKYFSPSSIPRSLFMRCRKAKEKKSRKYMRYLSIVCKYVLGGELWFYANATTPLSKIIFTRLVA